METQKYYFDFFSDASTLILVMASPYRASRSHSSDTPHSLGLLWVSYQLDVETSTLQRTTLTSDRQLCLC